MKKITLSGDSIHSTREQSIRALKDKNSIIQGFTGTLDHVAEAAVSIYGVETIIYTNEDAYFSQLVPISEANRLDEQGRALVDPAYQQIFDSLSREEKEAHA